MCSRLFALALISSVLTLGSSLASAQTALPEEAVKADGAIGQNLALTAVQKHVIYNAVLRERMRAPVGHAPVAAVGAAVPPATPLLDLPEQAVAGDPSAALLKYAMVESDVVVVDPLSMRVIEVIHGGATP